MRLILLHTALLAITLLPVFSVDIPALTDYINHLARMQILASYGQSTDLQAIYSINLTPLPNLAMEAVVPLLTPVVGLEMADKLFVALVIMLLVSGTLLLSAAVHGRLGMATLAVHLMTYNLVLSYGFLNYLAGAGLALALFALWIGMRNRPAPLRAAVIACGVVAVHFCHLAAACVLALAIGCYELWEWSRNRPLQLAGLVRRTLWASLAMLPVPILLALSWAPPETSTTPSGYTLSEKLQALLTPLGMFLSPMDAILSIAFYVLAFISLRSGAARFHPRLLWPVLAMGLSVFLVPSWLMDNWGNGFRLMVPFLLLAVAALSINPEKLHPAAMLGLAAATLLAIRIGTVQAAWRDYDRMFAEIRTASASLPAGTRVLPVVRQAELAGHIAPYPFRAIIRQIPALVALERPVFLPTLFTASNRQPLRVKPDYAGLDVPHARPIPMPALILLQTPEGTGEAIRRFGIKGDSFHRFTGWQNQFEYVLALEFSDRENPLPDVLEPASKGSYFTFYKVRSN